jgi:alanine racemase
MVVELDAVHHNTRILAAACDATGADLMAVVKTDAYGHGARPVARTVLDAGATWLGVATTGEALELREAGIDAPILAWMNDSLVDFCAAIEAGVDVSVASVEQLDEVVEAAACSGTRARVHVEVDTGLSRGGARATALDHLLHRAVRGKAQRRLEIVALWSHLSHGECRGHPSIDVEAGRLDAAVRRARQLGLCPARHLCGSLPTLTRPDLHHSMVRPGAGLYGLLPVAERCGFDLRPAMRALTHVMLVKHVPAGQGVCYEHHWTATDATVLALIPAGYADGLPRALAGRLRVSIRGQRHRVVGICMDQSIVDCGDAPVAAGDEVVLMGSDEHGEPTVYDWAATLGTTPCEVVTNLARPYVSRTIRGGRG